MPGPPQGRLAIFPGSFDPLTNGHVDIILRSAHLFERIIVAVLVNAEKSPLFTMAERVDIATDSIVPLPPGWDTKEFAITSIDPLGGEQHLRAIVAAHDGIAITLELPETLARQAPAFFSRLIGSIQ